MGMQVQVLTAYLGENVIMKVVKNQVHMDV